MPKQRKKNATYSVVTSDSESENNSSKMHKKDDDNFDKYISNTGLISNLNFHQCFDIIKNCCSIQDKRSVSKYADAIIVASENMKKMYDDLFNKCNTNVDESNKLLLEIRDKLNAPIPYNVVAAKPKHDSSFSVSPTNSSKPNEFTLFVNANEGVSSNDINGKVNQAIKDLRKVKPCLKINKIIRSAKGNIIKMPNSNDLDVLIDHFRKIDQFNSMATVFIPKPRDPTIVLKKVNKFTQSKDIPSILSNVNEQLSGLESEIKVAFEFRSSTFHRDIVLRVSPNVFNRISHQDILFTDFEAVKFYHRVFVRQCKFCFQFNSHKSTECPRKDKPICSDCGSEGTHQCSKIHNCLNCINYFKNNVKSNLVCHKPNTIDCPLYQKQIDKIFHQTAFKPFDFPSSSRLTTTIELSSQQSSSSMLIDGQQN